MSNSQARRGLGLTLDQLSELSLAENSRKKQEHPTSPKSKMPANYKTPAAARTTGTVSPQNNMLDKTPSTPTRGILSAIASGNPINDMSNSPPFVTDYTQRPASRSPVFNQPSHVMMHNTANTSHPSMNILQSSQTDLEDLYIIRIPRNQGTEASVEQPTQIPITAVPLASWNGSLAGFNARSEVLTGILKIHPTADHQSYPSLLISSSLSVSDSYRNSVMHPTMGYRTRFPQHLPSSASNTTNAGANNFAAQFSYQHSNNNLMQQSPGPSNANSLVQPGPIPGLDELEQPPIPSFVRPTDMLMYQNSTMRNTWQFHGGPNPVVFNNYRSSLTTDTAKRIAINLPDHKNCTLFVWNLPTTIAPRDFFDIITTGRVFSLKIAFPNERHRGSAAKLVFMEPKGAAGFMALVQQGLWLHGKQLHARFNDIGHKECTKPQSRVLMIEGPIKIMNQAYWEKYFAQVCIYQFDRVVTHCCNKPNRGLMEFRFIRVDGQANMCYIAIQHQDGWPGGRVFTWYGPDPCDRRT